MRWGVDPGELWDAANSLARGQDATADRSDPAVALCRNRAGVTGALPGLTAAGAFDDWVAAVGERVQGWAGATRAHAVRLGPGAGAGYQGVDRAVRAAVGSNPTGISGIGGTGGISGIGGIGGDAAEPAPSPGPRPGPR